MSNTSGGMFGLRCDLASDVAQELISIARDREADAREVMRRFVLRVGERNRCAGDLYAEAAALRSLAYAINKHNMRWEREPQPTTPERKSPPPTPNVRVSPK